jgi:hypothetical protein
MKRLFGSLAGSFFPDGQRRVTVINEQGVHVFPPATYKTAVHCDTADDYGLARYSITLNADFTVLHTGDQYYGGGTFTGTRGQCVGIGAAQRDLSTMALVS